MTQHASTALFTYPDNAAFGRVVPKSKLYEHATVGTRLKHLLTEQVEQIVWQYKLAPETTNLPASPDVPEIQVFHVRLKTPELQHDVLRCIDKAIPFPIVFELQHEDRVQMIACHKRPNDAQTGRWICSDYFATGWLAASSARVPLPAALNLGGLYEQLLKALILLAPRPAESLVELLERSSKVRALQREVAKASTRLEAERQFNRKVEINAHLRQLKNEFEALSQ